MKKLPFVLALILGVTSVAFAEEAKEEKKAAAPASDSDFFRCVRVRNSSLVELKLRMVDECNLSKPFALSATDIAVDSSFTYCCHKK